MREFLPSKRENANLARQAPAGGGGDQRVAVALQIAHRRMHSAAIGGGEGVELRQHRAGGRNDLHRSCAGPAGIVGHGNGLGNEGPRIVGSIVGQDGVVGGRDRGRGG